MGRPTKFSKKLAERIYFLTRKGLTDEEACFIVDISRETLYEWKDSGRFSDALKDGKAQIDERVERCLLSRAMGYTHEEEKIFQYEGKVVRAKTLKHYPPDPLACMMWLRNRKPKEWRENSLGAGGGDTYIFNNIKSTKKGYDELVRDAAARLSGRARSQLTLSN